MTKFFPRQLLYRLRNEIPVAKLVPQLDWPHKHREGRFCFLCPRCGEFLTAVNPRTNLARCFACETNFNPIDLVSRSVAQPPLTIPNQPIQSGIEAIRLRLSKGT